jgi:hypothetical protein
MVDVLDRPLHAGSEEDHPVCLFAHAFGASEWDEDEDWDEDEWEEDEDEDEDWDEEDEDWDEDEWEEEDEDWEEEAHLRQYAHSGEWY